MAMPLAKLTILVGAGIVGTILTKEGRLGDVTSFFSSAFKIVRKNLQEEKGNSSSSSKPASDYLLTQVNSLRKQLQNIQASGPVTIVTERSGSGTYRLTVIFLVGVAGYGYAWWKGWKFSDMMYVTKRRWLDARESVAKQVDNVSSSVTTTRKELSSRIDRVSCSLEDCLEVTVATKKEVTELHTDISGFHVDVETVQKAVETLGSKLGKIEGTQDFTTNGVYHLCQFAKQLESRKSVNPPVLRCNSARLALEHPQDPAINRATSLPPSSASEPPSPSKVETPRVLQSSRSVRLDSFKEVQGLTSLVRTGSGVSTSTEPITSTICKGTPPPPDEKKSNESASTSVRQGWRLPSFKILSRTRTAADVS